MLHIWWRGFKDQTVGQTFGIPHRAPFDVADRLSSKVLSPYRPKDVNIIAVNLLPPYDFFFLLLWAAFWFNAERSKEKAKIIGGIVENVTLNVKRANNRQAAQMNDFCFTSAFFFYFTWGSSWQKKKFILCAFLCMHKKLVFQYEKISQLNQTIFYLWDSQQRLFQDN